MKKLILFLFILSTSVSFAQESIDLNPVTVTSNRTPQKSTETGRNITVMDGKLFNLLPVRSLDELLKFVPGVEVQTRGPLGAQSDIVIRGGTFQQVLVLIDGIKLNDPITGHFSSYIPIAASEIERIEILRGPASALYGSEAVGGVINIITKTFSRFSKTKQTTADIGIAAGEYSSLKVNSGIQSSSEKINSSFGILSNTTSGQLLRGNNRGFVHNNTVSGSVSLLLKRNWQLSFRSGYDSRDFAAQNFYTTFKSDTATEKVKTWWNQLQARQQKENSSHQFDVVYKRTSDYYLFNPVSVANENKSNNIYFQYLYSRRINRNFSTTVGTILDRRAIISNDRGNHETNHGAVFGTLLYSHKMLRISPSLRFDTDQNFGNAFLPQLNISYQIKSVNLRANAGKTIRGGDFTERFNNYNKALVKSGNIGNPDLNTENSWSFEAGGDAYIGKNFKFSVTGFYRDQDNVIDWVATPYSDMPRKENLISTGSYALSKNLKKVKTSGIEFDLAFQKIFSEKQTILITSGATFLKSTTSDAVPSFYILSHAKTLIQTNIIYTVHRVNISCNLIYKERNPQYASAISLSVKKDYFVINGRIGYSFAKDAEFFIDCSNITNTHYSDLLGSIMPGSWTLAGVKIKL